MSRYHAIGTCIMCDDALVAEDYCSIVDNDFSCPECCEEAPEEGETDYREFMYRYHWL